MCYFRGRDRFASLTKWAEVHLLKEVLQMSFRPFGSALCGHYTTACEVILSNYLLLCSKNMSILKFLLVPSKIHA